MQSFALKALLFSTGHHLVRHIVQLATRFRNLIDWFTRSDLKMLYYMSEQEIPFLVFVVAFVRIHVNSDVIEIITMKVFLLRLWSGLLQIMLI